VSNRAIAQLEAGIDLVIEAPRELGTLALIVRRPSERVREVLEVGQLNLSDGLLGDSWKLRVSRTPTGRPDPQTQVNVMSARAAALIAGDADRWQLAGDQLYVDFDISEGNLPIGSHLAIGDAVLQVSEKPHAGCKKFSKRFGVDALRFVNSEAGRELRLRGFNASVIVPGPVERGDPVRRQP